MVRDRKTLWIKEVSAPVTDGVCRLCFPVQKVFSSWRTIASSGHLSLWIRTPINAASSHIPLFSLPAAQAMRRNYILPLADLWVSVFLCPSLWGSKCSSLSQLQELEFSKQKLRRLLELSQVKHPAKQCISISINEVFTTQQTWFYDIRTKTIRWSSVLSSDSSQAYIASCALVRMYTHWRGRERKTVCVKGGGGG